MDNVTQTTIEHLQQLFSEFGQQKYADEGVTQLEHAVQSGQLAREADNTNPILVVAALLHDVGHLLAQSDWPSSCDENLDDRHEEIGHSYLVEKFGLDIAEPVRLHVAAKRYLCTVEPDYVDRLSPTSRKSYFDQGGPMSEDEVNQFRSNPYYEQAVQLRHWDDLAKREDLPPARFEDFLPELEAVLKDG